MFKVNDQFKFSKCSPNKKPMVDICPKLRRSLSRRKTFCKTECKKPLLIEGMIDSLITSVTGKRVSRKRKSPKRVKKVKSKSSRKSKSPRRVKKVKSKSSRKSKSPRRVKKVKSKSSRKRKSPKRVKKVKSKSSRKM